MRQLKLCLLGCLSGFLLLAVAGRSLTADFGLFPSIIVTRLSQEGRHNSNNPKDIRVATHLLATEFLIEGFDAPDFCQLAAMQQHALKPA